MTSNEVRHRVNELGEAHCALFAALICDKLYPNYLLFAETENWGSPTTFRDGVELLFDMSLTGIRPVADAEKLVIAFDLVFPDLDDFSGITPSYAFDASTALSEALRFVLTDDKEHIVNCSTAARDTVDMFVQELHDLQPNRPDLEGLIAGDPYVIMEAARQKSLLNLLIATPVISVDLVTQLRIQQTMEPGIIDIKKLLE